MKEIDAAAAADFLKGHFRQTARNVELIGAGAWSRCFGFQLGDEDLVIRFGGYREDFAKDQLAYRYASAALPIPEVLDIGSYEDGFYAISRRAYGGALEGVSPAGWTALLPALVDALEALRTADLSGTSGFGGWDGQGQTRSASWSAELLTVGIDWPEQRTHGWLKRLAEGSPAGHATFRWGLDLLESVITDDSPRCLLHCDLINRNVLVAADQLTAVFDWGCGRYGDHLYELAWFEFWAPWHPNLDIPRLRAALAARWQASGYQVANIARRLATCYLHIGLDHLAYNAYLGDWATLQATADRMKALVTPVIPSATKQPKRST